MSISIETNKIIELSECNLESKTLLTGTLLKWMDIIACLAAEKCANVPCVTASVDDLQIDKTIQLGQVVTLKATINRVFNTSMEVEVFVTTEDIQMSEKSEICKAYFTFVTQPDRDGKKNYVQGFEPVTEHEKVEFALAKERKKLRIEDLTTLKKIKEAENMIELEKEFQDTLSSSSMCEDSEDFIYPKQTQCECVEIVLPQHANHHQTTFGGQLMAWMEATATISARRLCHGQPRLLFVDEVFFKAPSKVGDRIVIQSTVTNTFERSLEVGVRVEAYAVGGLTRHINSAYFTFITPDENGNPKCLPRMKAKDWEDCRMMRLAEARVKMRQERRLILSKNEPLVSVTMSGKNQKILCYRNIFELMALYDADGFKFKLEIESVRLSQLKIDNSLCIRIECDLDTSCDDVFDVLKDHTKRNVWDLGVSEVIVEKVIKEDEDYVVRYIMRNLSPQQNTKSDDMIMLASSRRESRLCIIAYRSVNVEDLPPVPEYQRVENRCSGFIIEPSKRIKNGSKITYINQLTEQIYKYVKNDLKGATATLSQRAIALIQLVKEGAKKS